MSGALLVDCLKQPICKPALRLRALDGDGALVALTRTMVKTLPEAAPRKLLPETVQRGRYQPAAESEKR